MKGVTHMGIGLACASCIPGVVVSASSGDPAFFILAAVYSILPDTIDFKFCRFFYPHHVTITPDPLENDAQLIASAVANTVHRACATGKELALKLNTINLAPDTWQSYSITFDTSNRQVLVRYGPTVTTGEQVDPASPGFTAGMHAAARLSCDLSIDYQATIAMGSFEGPVIKFSPAGRCMVQTEFIPWHRQWSHSFAVGFLFAGLSGLIVGPVACAVAFAAYTSHILTDQLGFLGSNLFFPFARKRTPGLKLDHSTGSFTNPAIVWGSCLLLFWNLYRSAPGHVAGLNFAKLAGYGLILPIVIVVLVSRARR